MRTIDIRKRLIEEINSSSNKNLLEEMYNFLSKDNATDELYKLSRTQKYAIKKGRDQIKSGQSFSNDEVNIEIEKWLNGKQFGHYKLKITIIQILEYWIEHNKSNEYSKKLNNLFKEAVEFIAEFPTIGKLTDDNLARIKIVRDYWIVYDIRENGIFILAIFDSRQNPIKLVY